MSAKLPVQLFGARRWEMADEKTGEIREGTTLYVDNEEDEQRKPDPNHLGVKIMKMSAPIGVFRELALRKAVFPFECDLLVNLRLGAEGKAVTQVVGIAFD